MLDPYQRYKQQSIMTSDGAKLLIMLYSGLIKFLNIAKMSIEERNIQGANSAIIKAENILVELMTSLDTSFDISNDLIKIYDYMHDRLVQANIKKSNEILEEVLNMAVEMRDTWNQAIKLCNS
jgi:flagellar protein FliS